MASRCVADGGAAPAGRVRWRSRLLVGLTAACGLLFVCAVVNEKQRAWERAQLVSALAEDSAAELARDSRHNVFSSHYHTLPGTESLGASGSATSRRDALSRAAKLAALHKMLAKTALELQGTDAGAAGLGRRADATLATLAAARLAGSEGEEGNDGAERATGGATALAHRSLGVGARELRAGAKARHDEMRGLALQPDHATDVATDARDVRRLREAAAAPRMNSRRGAAEHQAAALAMDERDMRRLRELEPDASQHELAQSARSLAQDIRHEANMARLADAGGVQPTAPPQQSLSAIPAPAGTADPAEAEEGGGLSQVPGNQQLAEMWSGLPVKGAVFAPAVMTPYQQQMLQQYMGAPTVVPPPAVKSGARTQQQLGQLPTAQLLGAASPSPVAGESAASGRAGLQTARAAGATSELARVGRAVEHVALDSDGVLEHAESLMSEVRTDVNKIATAKSQGGRRARPSARPPATPLERKLLRQIAASKAQARRLKAQRARVLAKEYSSMAKSIPVKLSAARTQKLVVMKHTPRTVNATGASGTHGAAAVPAADAAENSTTQRGAARAGLPKLPPLHALPEDPATQQTVQGSPSNGVDLTAAAATMPRALLEGAARAVPKPGTASAGAVNRPAADPAGDAADAAQASLPVSVAADRPRAKSRGGSAESVGGGDGERKAPLVDVSIRDSRIVGGLHISRNTGERKGAGAQSGCGALCQLGKLVRNIQEGRGESLWGVDRDGARAPKMVEEDYVISHVDGKPVYAHELVPNPALARAHAATPERSRVHDAAAGQHTDEVGIEGGDVGQLNAARPAERRADVMGDDQALGRANAAPTTLSFASLEGGLERAIEREGERRGEARERRREQLAPGYGGFPAVGAVRQRAAADPGSLPAPGANYQTNAAAGPPAGSGAQAPAGYKAVHYAMPVSQYEAMTTRTAGRDTELALTSSGEAGIYDGLY